MELNEYQKQAMTTCMPSCDNFSYMMLNLMGEVGEFSSKVAKLIRKDEAFIDESKLYIKRHTQDEVMDALADEAGDIFWQLAGMCQVMGYSLEEIAQRNLAKLRSRAERGVIVGNGDNR